MKTRKFTIPNQNNEKLACIEVLPDNSSQKRIPAAILCHGFAYVKEEAGIFTDMAERLQEIGYAVYYFDFSGCGESEGNYRDTSLTKLANDLQSVYKTITEFDHIDPRDISLVGQSFGTSVTIAAQLPNISRIVLCGSFSDPYELFKPFFVDFNPDGVSHRERDPGEPPIEIGPQFWPDLQKNDLAKLISNYNCPILFIHGRLDDVVPMKLMEPLFEAAKHPVGPVILEKSDHGLRPERQKVFDVVADFFSV